MILVDGDCWIWIFQAASRSDEYANAISLDDSTSWRHVWRRDRQAVINWHVES